MNREVHVRICESLAGWFRRATRPTIKAGNKKKGKLHQGYYLPIYGDQDEMVFNYSASKSRQAVRGRSLTPRNIESLLDISFSSRRSPDAVRARSESPRSNHATQAETLLPSAARSTQ